MYKKKLIILASVFIIIAFIILLNRKRISDIYISDQIGDATQVFNLRVLQIAFNPTEGSKNLANTFFPNSKGLSAREIENNIANDNIQAFKRLSNNTINYSIVKKIDITTFPTYSNGFVYNFDNYADCSKGDPNGICERQKRLFDHVKWIQENRICQIAEENNIDEIWLVTNDYLTTWENFMIGSIGGFGVNGDSYDIPECKRHYIVVSPTYKQYENFLHNYGHRIEATMNYLTSNWRQEDKKKYWDDYAYMDRTYGQISYGGRDNRLRNEIFCGNAHFPSNADSHYDCNDTSYGKSNCEDWLNFPNFTGITKDINCTTWGCRDEGWQEYWFSYIPKSEGEILMQSFNGKSFYFKRNWWNYLLYPDNAIEFVKQTINGVVVNTPKPTPRITPTPTPRIEGSLSCNYDKDSVCTINDFILFADYYNDYDLKADLNIDNNVTIDDFMEFVEDY